ncbi:MAG TPA: DUF2332 family protein [Mesorhizobium sp.]|jgi:hypothetical protein|nr:DUF2332 family protein [Mesorhizobium sp.]
MDARADDQRITAHFKAQAEACERLGSPFTARLCRALAAVLDEATETGRRALSWPGDPGRDALALRLCGGLHFLVLSEKCRLLKAAFPPQGAPEFALRALFPSVIRDHDKTLLSFLDRPPQTNEAARAAVLLPGLLEIAREVKLPLSLHEIGASAGLNLAFDRFGFRYGEALWGDENSPVRLEPEIRGKPVPLGGRLNIMARRGTDVAPVNVSQGDTRLRLKAYVWPDQPARAARLEAAIRLAMAARVRVEAQDALLAVRSMLENRPEGAAAVLFHSVVWQYLPEETQAAIVEAMRAGGGEATPTRPLAWLRMEPGRVGDAALALTLWPGGATRHLADADFHGRWIAWR